MTRLRELIGPVFLPTFLFGIGQGAIVPLIAILAIERGAGLSAAGAIVALRGIAAMLASVPASALVARVGERRTVVLSAVVMVAALVLAMVSDQLWLYGAAIFLLGCSWAVWMLARLTFVASAVSPELRGRALSTLGGVSRVGTMIGPFLTAATVGLVSDAPFLIHLVAGLAATVVFVVEDRRLARRQLSPEVRRAPVRVAEVARESRGVLATAGVSIVVLSGLRACRDVIVPLAGALLGLDAAGVSLAYGLSLAAEAAVFYLGGLISDRWGRRWAAIPCLAGLSITISLLPVAGNLAVFGALAICAGFANGLGSGIVMTLGADFAPAQGATEFLGIWRLFSQSGAAAGPVALAALTGLVGLPVAGVVLGGVGLAGVVFHAVAVPEARRPAPP